jgi:hypothetical protein
MVADEQQLSQIMSTVATAWLFSGSLVRDSQPSRSADGVRMQAHLLESNQGSPGKSKFDEGWQRRIPSPPSFNPRHPNPTEHGFTKPVSALIVRSEPLAWDEYWWSRAMKSRNTSAGSDVPGTSWHMRVIIENTISTDGVPRDVRSLGGYDQNSEFHPANCRRQRLREDGTATA